MANLTLSQQLSDLGARLRFEDFPDYVVDNSKKLLLDILGNILAARHLESSACVVDIIKELGGAPTSSVIGFSHKTSAPLAALANATFAHSFDMDDDHRESGLHPSTVIFPAAYSMAERTGTGGRDLLTAFIYGSEIDVRLGEAFLGTTFYQGFHPSSTCGVFGAAGAGAKLMGLSAQQITYALGVAGSQASGLVEWKSQGTWIKRFQTGNAARGGVLGAIYGSKNYTSPITVLEGDDGFMRAFAYQGEYELGKITDGLGERWHMADTSIKVHACCRFAASPADASVMLFERGVKPDEIDNIHVKSNKIMMKILTTPADIKYDPQNCVHAQFSLPYIMACGIVKGQHSILEYTDEAIRDPKVLELAQKVTSELDPEAEAVYPKYYPCTIIVTKKDGTTETVHVDYPKGDPENPVYWDEAIEKFKFMSGFYHDSAAQKQIIDIITNLEKQEDLSTLFTLLS